MNAFRNTMRRSASRGFSTEARVHPNILPYLHNTRRTSMVPRWIPSTIAVIAVGYAASSYAMGMSQRRSARLAEMERQQAESRLRASKLMDAYGDGTSLESLERAVALYEAQNRS
ncbi:hypothetical protein D7B24_009281 [Verticillium nonalfalfae]|uniref:Predicted protein n=2 Tax=Verticillium TaxID=1036719 RepID=C9S807_VERA1|nr:predicted protein [Verticillium alfalfae VaMs.102]XP_028493059.1 uncharacterized protein D7B24_009281 [Verticillium nonalfalfae]EEY15297.1 predicted protein [Verticillium alfalfae VaMs.102]RNJ54901.1 hypothetical protein D7B24_009281 [Verticillium nonalfalfae]